MLTTSERREIEVENMDQSYSQLEYAQTQLDWVEHHIDDDSDLRSLTIGKFRLMVAFGAINDLDVDFFEIIDNDLADQVESLKEELVQSFQNIQDLIETLRV